MMLRSKVLAPLALTAIVACDDDGGTSNPTATATTTATTDTDATSNPDIEDPGCDSNAECTDPALPICDENRECVAARGALIGKGDGTAASVDLVQLYVPDAGDEAQTTDLEFHPTRNELWVLNRPFEVTGTCAQSNFNSARCRSLQSTTTIIYEPGTANQQADTLVDDNSWHFMRRAPAIAMGADDTFATCGEAFTGNFEDDPVTYIGPTLWSSDPDIYTHTPPGGNGSHLDMLHETPWCMGVAHERDNVYWLFNGEFGAVDRVDFHEPHEPGGDDHADGEVHRYMNGQVLRVPNVPSHLEFVAPSTLYIVDTGNKRILSLDTTSGTRSRNLQDQWEELAAQGRMTDEVWFDLPVPAGTFEAPSGLVAHDGLLYVSDNATSKLFAIDPATGEVVRSLETGLPAGSLAGINVGPDGKLYFASMLTGAVYRLDPK